MVASRFKRDIKSNSYLVHYRPHQGAKKGKQFVSSTNWGLGDNVALRPMEFFTPTAASFDLSMDNYFTSFHLLLTFELRTFEQEVCSTKIGYANIISLGQISAKEERGQFEHCSAHQAKTLRILCDWLERKQATLHNF